MKISLFRDLTPPIAVKVKRGFGAIHHDELSKESSAGCHL
jgi:hypothetical protein